MIALDTSVVVAAFGSWHESHGVAVATLASAPVIAEHTALEAYSSMTRLPEPFRAEPGIVAEYLRRTFPGQRLTMPEDQQRTLPGRLSELGIVGGQAYDALIALTARSAGARLLTLDRRATQTYERCGVEAELLAS